MQTLIYKIQRQPSCKHFNVLNSFFFNIGIIFEIKEFPFLLASRFLKSTVVQI